MSRSDGPKIAGLYRYPVKGLSPERLGSVEVEAGGTLPFDRAWAIENGPSGFDPASPRHLPKVAFLMLMRHERLAGLATRFDDADRTLEVARAGATVARGRLDDPGGRRAIEDFFAGFMEAELRGPPRIVECPGHTFSDVAMKCVSIINLATVEAIARAAGRDVDPLRFRGNIHIAGLRPWEEFGWVGATLRAGGVRLAGVQRISRCAATSVNPATARRDIDIPRLLAEEFGHTHCGVYARIDEAGRLGAGQPIEVMDVRG